MKLKTFFLLFICPCCILFSQTWRSSLYPENWQPGYTDEQGRFLHDFSYAGYHGGLKDIPDVNTNIVDVTKPPYNADNTGKKDVTSIIQRALNNVGKSGGGVVYLPAGEYAVSVDAAKNYGLLMMYDNVILRGAGTNKTFIKNTTTSFRLKQVIYVMGMKSAWNTPIGGQSVLTEDVPTNSTLISVEDVSEFKVGDLVVIATDITPAFAEEHGMEKYWSDKIRGQRYCRYITAIDKDAKKLTIDIPTKYIVQTRDKARVYKVGNHIKEAGLENFSIGNLENTQEEGWNTNENAAGKDDLAFMDEKTGAYNIHGTHFVVFRNAINCWARDIASFRPSENKKDVHFVSNALLVTDSRNVTVKDCSFEKPQYRGGGGNGYMFILAASDCLIENCWAKNARHNYSFKSMFTHGNVLYRCVGVEPRYSTDFHMHLSMANLIDGFISDGDYVDATFRPWGGISGYMHGHVTTESVIWNTTGLKAHTHKKFLVFSRQWGYGYVIGTSGNMNKVLTTPIKAIEEKIEFDTSPEDFVEGEGRGESLIPRSLYMDQLEKRKQRLSKANPQ